MEKQAVTLPLIRVHAAGIDVGSRSHVMAVDQTKENVRSFGVYTRDHQEIILHLRQYGITSVGQFSAQRYAPGVSDLLLPLSTPD